jgi:hypothetical protein
MALPPPYRGVLVNPCFCSPQSPHPASFSDSFERHYEMNHLKIYLALIQPETPSNLFFPPSPKSTSEERPLRSAPPWGCALLFHLFAIALLLRHARRPGLCLEKAFSPTGSASCPQTTAVTNDLNTESGTRLSSWLHTEAPMRCSAYLPPTGPKQNTPRSSPPEPHTRFSGCQPPESVDNSLTTT